MQSKKSNKASHCRVIEPALVLPGKNPPALVVVWRTTPWPVVVARPVPLPKVTVSKPVAGEIDPVRELVGLPVSFTNVLLLVTTTLKFRGADKSPPEMLSWPEGRDIAGVRGGGLVQGSMMALMALVKPE